MVDTEKIKFLVKEIQNLFYARKYKLIIKETGKAIKKYPNFSIFYNMQGLALTQLGKTNSAKIVLQTGYKINPDDLAIINNLANIYKNIFNYTEAEKLYELSISKKKDYFNAYVNYGNLKRDLNKFDQAIKLYETALNYNTEIPEIYYSLAMAHQSLGNFEKSDYYANQTLKKDRKITKADLLISRSKKYTKSDNHLNSMIGKINDKNLNQIQKIDLHFAIAKAKEDLGEIKDCFKHLEEGNKLKRSIINFDFKFEENRFTNIKEIFSKVNFKNLKEPDFQSKKIIFIIGMPRSGTTLTEQIISSHSEVYGSGELPYLTKIISEKFYENESLSSNKINNFFKDNDQLSEVSNKYYSYLKNYNIDEKYITDKAPLNFIWIGFIKALFPNAKIIHCRRNAKDNCVSLYKNVFDGNLNFCYTQKELGLYYNLYAGLMQFWKKHLPDSFLDIEYEKLISSTKEETKKILDYCDLQWEENCLDLSKNKSPIKTASVGQARNKIYSSSIESSLKYEDYLNELFNLL